MTYRVMYDSTTAADVPSGGNLRAGYVDGSYRTVPALLARFPDATVVAITVTGKNPADVCDTEPGNVGISAACAWAAGRVKNGHPATLYCMQSQWSAVRSELKKHLGWPARRKVHYWVAQYDGKASIPLTWRALRCVAKQYASSDVPAGHAGHCDGHKDISVVLPYWPGVDPIALSAARIRQLRRTADWLAKRQRPVGRGRHELQRVENQAKRVLGLYRW